MCKYRKSISLHKKNVKNVNFCQIQENVYSKLASVFVSRINNPKYYEKLLFTRVYRKIIDEHRVANDNLHV